MPAFYTHYTIAKETLRRLPNTIYTEIRPHLSLYFFGAQGADFCFFYPFFSKKIGNFGSYLHRHGGYPTLRVMQEFSTRSAPLFSYALGYITHYAADSTFHPFIYALAGQSHLLHSRLENTLDIYLKHRTASSDPYVHYLKQSLVKKELEDLFILYAAIAAKHHFPPLTKKAFSRAIFLFNAYMPISSNLFYQSKHTLSLLFNTEKKPWRFPDAPHVISTDGCQELLDKSITLAVSLGNTFAQCVQQKTPLPAPLFHKSFLTGLPLP